MSNFIYVFSVDGQCCSHIFPITDPYDAWFEIINNFSHIYCNKDPYIFIHKYDVISIY